MAGTKALVLFNSYRIPTPLGYFLFKFVLKGYPTELFFILTLAGGGGRTHLLLALVV